MVQTTAYKLGGMANGPLSITLRRNSVRDKTNGFSYYIKEFAKKITDIHDLLYISDIAPYSHSNAQLTFNIGVKAINQLEGSNKNTVQKLQIALP